MSDTRQQAPAKNGLRLIKGGEPAKPQNLQPTPDPMVEEEKAKRPKSNLGRFMAAYADAIDRDVALLLDL